MTGPLFFSILVSTMAYFSKDVGTNAAPQPAVMRAHIVATYPHDEKAFTQGLFFSGGRLYESTGRVGTSTLRRVNIRTGAADAIRSLPDDVFGEGATAVGDRVVSLTWRSGRGFVHDLETLSPEDEFAVDGEGWGLTFNGDHLIMSDGSHMLHLLDPETYKRVGGLAITLKGEPVENLNELEWVEGEIFANIWQSDWIVRINPVTGVVTGLIDVSALHPAAMRRNPRDDVANGIAYEPNSRRLFVTGKNWPSLFEIKLTAKTPPNGSD